MTILVTSDWQLDDNPANEYRHLTLQRFRWPEVNAILILGDLTEEKDNHSARLVNLVVGRIASLAKIAPVYVLTGNHDYVDRGFPYFAFLSWLKQVTYVDSTCYANFANVRGMFIPHTRDKLPDISAPIDYVFTHNTFEGAQVGYELSGHQLPGRLGRVKIISGDVHNPHTVGPVTYVGSPYTVDFGDDWEPRMLLINGKEMVSIKVPGPQKRLIEVQGGRFKQAFELAMDKGKLIKNDMLRVRVRLSADDVMMWPHISDHIRSWCTRHSISLSGGIEPIVPETLRQSIKKLADVTKSPRLDAELIDEFAEARKLDERTTATGHNLADKV